MSPLLALQEAAPAAAWWGTREWVFLSLWAAFSLLYWLNYRKSENPAGAALKVAGLLGFVYVVMWFFDWVAQPVPAAEAITFGLSFPAIDGSTAARIPLLKDALFWFVMLLLVMVGIGTGVSLRPAGSGGNGWCTARQACQRRRKDERADPRRPHLTFLGRFGVYFTGHRNQTARRTANPPRWPFVVR